MNDEKYSCCVLFVWLEFSHVTRLCAVQKPTELASVLRKGLGVTPEVLVDSTTSKAEEPEVSFL